MFPIYPILSESDKTLRQSFVLAMIADIKLGKLHFDEICEDPLMIIDNETSSRMIIYRGEFNDNPQCSILVYVDTEINKDTEENAIYLAIDFKTYDNEHEFIASGIDIPILKGLVDKIKLQRQLNGLSARCRAFMNNYLND